MPETSLHASHESKNEVPPLTSEQEDLAQRLLKGAKATAKHTKDGQLKQLDNSGAPLSAEQLRYVEIIEVAARRAVEKKDSGLSLRRRSSIRSSGSAAVEVPPLEMPLLSEEERTAVINQLLSGRRVSRGISKRKDAATPRGVDGGGSLSASDGGSSSDDQGGGSLSSSSARPLDLLLNVDRLTRPVVIYRPGSARGVGGEMGEGMPAPQRRGSERRLQDSDLPQLTEEMRQFGMRLCNPSVLPGASAAPASTTTRARAASQSAVSNDEPKSVSVSLSKSANTHKRKTAKVDAEEAK